MCREGAVMSLAMFLGARGDPLSESGQNRSRVRIESPVLNFAELDSIQQLPSVQLSTLSTLYPLSKAVRIRNLS